MSKNDCCITPFRVFKIKKTNISQRNKRLKSDVFISQKSRNLKDCFFSRKTPLFKVQRKYSSKQVELFISKLCLGPRSYEIPPVYLEQ